MQAGMLEIMRCVLFHNSRRRIYAVDKALIKESRDGFIMFFDEVFTPSRVFLQVFGLFRILVIYVITQCWIHKCT